MVFRGLPRACWEFSFFEFPCIRHSMRMRRVGALALLALLFVTAGRWCAGLLRMYAPGSCPHARLGVAIDRRARDRGAGPSHHLPEVCLRHATGMRRRQSPAREPRTGNYQLFSSPFVRRPADWR